MRSFLRYICEAEFGGRAQQLNEYVLGVSVLGRPPDYSPAEDSCVRSRAYELRNTLKSYYRLEAPDDPIQIEIDKGAYVPRFERRRETKPAERAQEPAEPGASRLVEPPPETAIPGPRRSLSRPSIAVFVLAVLVASISFYFFYIARERPGVEGTDRQGLTPEMAALWKPFLDSGAHSTSAFSGGFMYSPTTSVNFSTKR